MTHRTIVEVRTRVTVKHGDVSCEARPESDALVLDVKDIGTIRIPVAHVLSVLEALGGAYDWRKRKLMETAVTGAAP